MVNIDLRNEKITSINKFVSLTKDTTFKYLYKSADTRKWLNEIILDKTGVDLTDYLLIDNENNTGSNIKDYRMDLVLSKEEDIVIVEMNNYDGSVKGIQYLFRKAGNRFDKGETFNRQPKTKLIMFNNYYSKLGKDIDVIEYKLYANKPKHYLDILQINEIYLPCFHQKCYNELGQIDKRLWLFGTKNYQELEKVLTGDNKHIIEELRRLSMNNKFIDEYNYEQVRIKEINTAKKLGFKEGVNQGISQGISQNNLEIAKKMLKEKLSFEIINKITGLSKKELENLI